MPPASSRGALLSTLASLASLAAALSCCLPLGTLLLSAGSAGASLFSEKLRPWLLALSAAALVFAFVETYFRARCDFRHRRLRTVLLWFSAVVVVGMLIFPRAFSSVLAGTAPWAAPTSPLRTFEPAAFIHDFNGASRTTRLVVLLSPTCTTCLRGASAVEEVLQQPGWANVRVFVVWEPVLTTDWGTPSPSLTAAIADPRATHYWDRGHRLSSMLGGPPNLNTLAENLSAGFKMSTVIWDTALVYPAGATWGAKAKLLVAPIVKYRERLQIQVQDSALQRDSNRVRTVGRAQFADNVLHMHLDGSAGSAQTIGDVLVRQPLGDE